MSICNFYFSCKKENDKIFDKFCKDVEKACNDFYTGKKYVVRNMENYLLKTFINEVDYIAPEEAKDHFLVVCDICNDEGLIKYLFNIGDQILYYYGGLIELNFTYIDNNNYYSTDNTGIFFSPVIVTYYSSGELCVYNAKGLEDANEFKNNHQKYVKNAKKLKILTVVDYKI